MERMTSALPRPLVSGAVHVPQDADYAPEIAAFNTDIRHAPDLVVAASGADDVVRSVAFAREQGMSVSVQSTGHGAHTAVTGGLLISTRRLNTVHVDPGTRTATVGGGAQWGAVIAAAAEHGLAPIPGSSATVGVVGYLLGGGLGPFARSHGFSSDYVLGLTVVTGAGELVEATADENPDLFWALRGGKYGFGVVTEVRLRLVELDPLYAGALFFAEDDIEAAMRTWADWTASADPAVTTSAAIIRFPPLDVVPEPFRGRRLLSLRFAYPGSAADGERLAAPLRAAAPVYLDALAEMPAAQMARIHNDPTEPGPSWTTGAMLTHLDKSAVDVLLSHVGAGTDAPFVAVELRHVGSATSRDVPEGSAVGGREGAFALGLVSLPVPDLFRTATPAAAAALMGDLTPWRAAETTVNFANMQRPGESAPRSWSPAVVERLAEIRHRYDPTGVLAVPTLAT
jgi:FAD/FMN-containing dehydrogenase